MSKIKLKRSLMLAALLGVGNNVVNATDYGAITNGTVLLEDGDTVTSSDSTGINSSTVGSGVHVNGAVEIEVVHTGSESKGVYLDNGAQNNLGSGSKINVENISGASNLTTVGVSVENKNNAGTSLVANDLTVTVKNDKNVFGVSSSGSSNVTIDLGTKSDISASTTGASSLVRAVDLGVNNTFKMDEGIITASGVNGQIYGIYTSGKADIQLGDQTTINATSTSGYVNGMYLSSSGTGTTVTANELKINATGTTAYGIYGKGNIDLGSGGKIDIKGSAMANGVNLTTGSSLKADGIEVVVDVGAGSGYGIYVQNSTADLGSGTSVEMLGTGDGQGVFAMGATASIVANELTVSTKTAMD